MRSRHLRWSSLCVAALAAGCAGTLTYTPPASTAAAAPTSVVVPLPRDEAWSKIIPRLGQQFFVINNLDKASGFINLSFSGDPEQFVDCGRIVSEVTNARGTRVYDFPAARGFQAYEVMDPSHGLFRFERRMTLEGRVNLVLQDEGPSATRVVANTRYVLSRENRQWHASGRYIGSQTDTIAFGSGQLAELAAGQSSNIHCRSNGRLEQQLLDLIR